jgi:(2Fe-2S) ferredoxin
MPKPRYHIIVCTNSRPPGHPKPSCGAQGSAALLMAFNMGLMQRGIQPGDVLVTGSACLGPCEQGPTIVVYPDGVWYSKVSEADVSTILDEHIGKGTPVQKLNPDAIWR